ncbi:MAG: glutamate--tRNA ligase [Alphaproteobacteria bacterium]|nr:glutamate--tRNA ligase [Alphaproteobacteria bacterium]
MSTNSTEIVTRFAPSPTGYLHIGGARTALFNWLYARGRGGRFLLRIEDTDRARHDEDAVKAILDGLAWLGLDWDGDPVSQHARAARHREIALDLLAREAAYRCFMTQAEIETARETARAENRRFESPWRDAAPAAIAAKDAEGAAFTIRFKAPRDGETLVEDAVQGAVRFPNSALDDLIILRSAGNHRDGGDPTYNLAVVVDDHDMGVTHVIRGDDHLNNAARQSQIYDALGWPRPVFAHVPLIHGSDGAKLSKRHGALGVEAYRDEGFLPQGLANYLLRLGWASGDHEILTMADARSLFDLDGINKAPARLDLEKLRFVNERHLRATADDALLEMASAFLPAGDAAGFDGALRRAMPFLKDRMSVLADIVDVAAFIFLQRPLDLQGKAGKPLRKDGAIELLADLRAALGDAAPWADPAAMDEFLKLFAEKRDIGFGQVGPPVRAALTAGRPSPSLGETLYILGAAESIARLDDALELQ